MVLAIVATGATALILLLRTPTLPKFNEDPNAFDRLNKNLREVQEANAAGASGVLHIDEAEVNTVLASQLSWSRNRGTATSNIQTNASVRDLKLKLADDRMHVYLLLGRGDRQISIDLEGKLRARDGYAQFTPLSGHIGTLPLPQSVLEKCMREIMNSPEGRERMHLPPNMKDLKVENGEFVVTYKQGLAASDWTGSVKTAH